MPRMRIHTMYTQLGHNVLICNLVTKMTTFQVEKNGCFIISLPSQDWVNRILIDLTSTNEISSPKSVMFFQYSKLTFLKVEMT